jgi:DNA (cytosine-5)-methyltransferase 1
LRGWAIEPSVGRVVNGIPNRPHRIKGLGNAVVPQIPELIGRAILESRL